MASPGGAATAGGAPARKKKVRSELLRGFYDGETAPANPLDINSPAFNHKQYMDNLLKTKDLANLMLTDRELKKEVRRLDSELKTLVYENYNKFISATDTIRKMKANVSNMETEMQRLATDMDRLSQYTTRINTSLMPRRTEIENMSSVVKMLRKRQFLFDLPTTLKRCIELETYDEAISYFQGASPTLKEYPAVFKHISNECDAIMSELQKDLNVKSMQTERPIYECVEYLCYLLQLGADAQFLCTAFMKSRGDYLESKLKTISEQHTLDLKIVEFIVELNGAFLIDFLEFCRSFQTVFVHVGGKNVAEKVARAVQFNPSLALGGRERKKLLKQFARDVLSHYFHIVRSRLAATSVPTADALQALEIIYRQLMNLHVQLPDLSFADRAGDIVNSAVNTQIERLADSVQPAISDLLEKANKRLSPRELSALIDPPTSSAAVSPPTDSSTPPPSVVPTLESLMNDTSAAIFVQIQDFMTNVAPFFHNTDSYAFLEKFCPVFSTKLHIKLQQLLLWLNVRFRELCEVSSARVEAKEMSPAFILLLSRMAINMSTSGVRSFQLQLQETTPQSTHDVMNASELSNRFRETTERLLGQYVRLQGQQLAHMIRAGIAPIDWTKCKEPRDVRLAFLLECLEGIDKEVQRLFAGRSGPLPRADSRSQSRNNDPTALGRQLFDSMLFNSKAKLFVPVTPEKHVIVSSIVKLMIKSLMEYLRVKTFGRNGLQQMQIEIHFLRLTLPRFADDQSVIGSLLDATLASAMERALEPVLLDQSIVSRICEQKLAKLVEKPTAPTEASHISPHNSSETLNKP